MTLSPGGEGAPKGATEGATATPQHDDAAPIQKPDVQRDGSGDPDLRQPVDVRHPVQLPLPLPGLADIEDQAWQGPEEIAELAATGQNFTAVHVRKRAGVPTNRNRVGAAFLAAAARGDIVAVGIARSSCRSRHAGKVTIWRGAVQQQRGDAA